MKFIYQYKASMSLDYAVRLPRHVSSSTFINGNVNSTFSKNTDVSIEPTGVKRHSRMFRKRTFQDNFNTEDNNQSDNIKKKKCVIKKQQSTKTETEKPITNQKNCTKTNSEVSTFEKIMDNSTNMDINVMPDTISPGGISEKVNDSTISIESSLNIPNKKIRYKSNISFAKKMNISNQNVTSNNLDKSNNSALPKPTKYKSSKSISPIKVKFTTNNINKSDKSNGLETSNNFVTLKTTKRKGYSKSVTPIKNKCLVNSITKDDSYNKLEKSNNLITSKSPKNKTTKSIAITKKKSISNSTNKNETPSNDSEKKNDLITSKTQKNGTSKSITTLKKMLVTNDVNKNNKSGIFEETEDIVVTRKRGRSSLKKIQLQNYAINYNDMVIDLEHTKKSTVLSSPGLMIDPVDNTIMLRSNKPPKIKKKWSDKWCGNKSSKYNADDHLSTSKIATNGPDNLNKKPLRIQKPKNSNHKKLKTKILEKLNTNINDSVSINVSHTCDSVTNSLLSIDIPNTNDIADQAKTNILGIQNHSTLIINSDPFTKSTVTADETITESVKINNNEPYNIETISSSEVNTLPTTSAEMSNALFIGNGSHITFEPVNDSSYLSVPESEISYGISILSEAISRQCNETINNSTTTNSSKQDIYEMKFSQKKTNSNSQPLLPNTIIQPHKNKTMLKEMVKYSSEFCNQSNETELQSHIDHELCLLSKRFNIPVDVLKKTVIDEPLSIFQQNYSASVTPSMIRVTPIVNDIEAKSKDHITGNLNVEYKLDPIRESAAYEQTNLKDLMTELSKTMPSWSLSIVTNPPRYVISHMSINKYGVPIANKSIVLDNCFRASVYINQCLEHKYCKLCSTATEIINLIKNLNSI